MFDKVQSMKVKGVAILMLIFHHLFYSAQRIEAGGISFSFLQQDTVMSIATGMRLCVWIFVFISAYGLTIQYEKLGENPSAQDVAPFVFKRWISLMRPYWTVFVLTIVVCALLLKNPLELFGGNFVGMLFGAFAFSDFFGTKMPVAAWWYMCFAQIVVFLIPFLADLCKKYGVLVLVAAFVLLPFAGEGIVSPYGGAYWNYLFVVIMGVLCAQNRLLDKMKCIRRDWYFQLSGSVGLFFVIVLCVWINMKYSSEDPLRLTKMLMGFAAVLVCLFVYQYVNWKPVEKALVFLGKYSGYIFLTHAFGYTYFPKLIFWSGNAVITYITLLLFGLILAIVCERITSVVHTYKPYMISLQKKINTRFVVSDTFLIKGVATIILLATHLFNRSETAWSLFEYNPEWMINGKPLITMLVTGSCGKICVDLFVIMSGYGLNHGIHTRSPDRFSLTTAIQYSFQRIVKLMLNFWCVYIVFVGIFTLTGKLNLMGTYGEGVQGVGAALIDFLGLRDILYELLHTGTINVAWWYMSTILLLYILFPLFRYFVQSKERFVPLILFLLINIMAPYLTYRQMKTGCFFYLSAFYLGMLFSEMEILDRLKQWISKFQIIKLICGIIVLIFAFALTCYQRYWGELIYAVAWLYVCVALFMGEHGLLRSKIFRTPLEVIGKHSSNIFMFHTFFLFNCQDFVYLLKKPILILIWFTFWMTIVSAVFEFIKEKVGFYKFQQKMLNIFR